MTLITPSTLKNDARLTFITPSTQKFVFSGFDFYKVLGVITISPCRIFVYFSRSDDNLPTPGWGEAPLSFHERLNAKQSSSLQGFTKARADIDDATFPVPDELERFLYGNAALNLEQSDSTFENANESMQSLTDWEEMKNQLKKDHQVITRRVSNRKKSENGDATGLDPTEHFYYKPSYSRKDAESALHGCPEGAFL